MFLNICCYVKQTTKFESMYPKYIMSYHKCLKWLPNIEKIPSFIFIGFKVPIIWKIKILAPIVWVPLLYIHRLITNASCTRWYPIRLVQVFFEVKVNILSWLVKKSPTKKNKILQKTLARYCLELRESRA